MAAFSRNEVSNRGESLVVDWGHRKSTCGYCKSSSPSSITHGLRARSLTVDDYQDLIDRGWRRSGCYLYKPEMDKTCCPLYTIRLKAADFIPNKEQARVWRRMQRFLDGELDPNKPDTKSPKASQDMSTTHHDVSSSAAEGLLSINSEEKSNEELLMCYLSDQIENAVVKFTESSKFPCNSQLPKALVKKVSHVKKKLEAAGSEVLLYTSNFAFQVAAVLTHSQLRKDDQQLKSTNHNAEDNNYSPKILAEKIANLLGKYAETSGLSVRACNGHINFYSAAEQTFSNKDGHAFDVSKQSASRSKNTKKLEMSFNHQTKKRKLEIIMKRSSFDPEEFELYRRYEIQVHNRNPDTVKESSYRRFLVETPLVFVPPTGDRPDGTVPRCGFGSFHQQYFIDGNLIAVGVIDILPKCLSSKYLFCDPEFAFLSLGKYSAMQEINWVKENQPHCPTLDYYYMGYYIHSCHKMRYKAAYRPSDLLCPLRYQWVSYDIAKALLDRKPYVVLSDFAAPREGELSKLCDLDNVMEVQNDDITQGESNDVFMEEDEEVANSEAETSNDEPEGEASGVENDINSILLGLDGTTIRYKDLENTLRRNQKSYLETQLHNYRKLVGKELSERMVYSIS